ncbi:MAG TPA: competence protein ComJ [Ktedonobacteraceae bacterium]|nr:competence protein ComJ [Ktedonobacteraceae bacterium]
MTQQQWEFYPTLVYSFFTVSLPPGPVEHNDWSPLQSQQGFSWQPRTVSFGTIDADGEQPVYVELRQRYIPSEEAIVIIKVPFEVFEHGILIADPLSNEWAFPIPQGSYALYFTIEPLGRSWQYHLTFVSENILPEAEILRATSPYLSPPAQLVLRADIPPGVESAVRRYQKFMAKEKERGIWHVNKFAHPYSYRANLSA